MSETSGLILGYISLGIIFLLLILTLCTKNSSKSSYTIWHFISWLYIFKWYPSINSEVSPVLKSIFKGIQKSFHPISIVPLSTSTHPLSSNFKSLGLSTPYFLNNIEMTLSLWTSTLLLYLIFLICCKQGPFKRSVCENLIIRSSLIFYSEFSVVSFIQMGEFEISTWYGVMNSIISVSVISCLVLMMFFLPFITFYKKKAENEEGLERIATLFEEFRKNSMKNLLFYTFFMIERFLTAAVLGMLVNFPAIQSFVIIFLLFCKIVFILLTMPFEATFLNFFVAGLDFFSICSVVLIISCEADLEDSTKTILAWGVFALVALGLTVCIFLVFRAILSKKDTNVVKTETKSEEVVDRTHFEYSIDLKNANTFHEIKENNREEEKVDYGRRKSIKNDENFKRQGSEVEEIEKDTRHDNFTRNNRRRVQDSKNENNREETFQNTSSRLPYYGPLFQKYLSRETLK